MTERANLVLGVDSRQVKKGQKDLKGLEKQGNKTEKATDQLGQAFRRIAGPIAVFLGTKQILAAADAWTSLGNRLRLVTDSTESLAAAQDSVFQIAQKARQPLENVAELYQRIATNQDALGISGERVAGVVDTISKAVAISGTSATAANAALIQLGQGFAAGTLRGQELNSVLEQAPALAQAIAKGLGVEIGQLKALGESGTLTAKNVIDALESQADSVNAQFETIRSTVSQSFTVLGNSMTRTVGLLDEATGASGDFANSILGISKFLDSGALTDGILDAMSLWRSSIDATISSLGDTSDEMELLGDIGGGVVDTIITAFKQLPVNIRALMQIVGTEIADTFARGEVRATFFADAVAAIFNDDTVDAALARRRESMERLDEVRLDSLSLIIQERDAILEVSAVESARRDLARAATEDERKAREARLAALRADAKGVSLGGGASKDELAAAKKLQDLNDRTLESLTKQKALFGQTGEAAEIRYEVELGALSQLNDLQKQRLIQLAVELDALEAQAEFAEKVQEIIDEAMPDAEKEIASLQENILMLGIALDEGKISVDQYATSVGQIKGQIAQVKEENDEFGKQLAELGDEIDDSLMTGITNAIGGVEDWEKAFIASIAKILIQLAALKLQQSGSTLFGADSGDGPSIGGSIIKGLLSFDGGGNTPSGPRSGGVDGKGGFLSVVHPDEKIIDLTKQQSAGGASSNISFNFPGVTDRDTAKRAGADAARKFNQMTANAKRYN